MTASVDPDRWFTSRSTGRQILAGLGLALGAIGGVAGNGNIVAQQLQKVRDTDIAQQQADIARGEKGAGLLGKLATDYENVGMDKASAMQMALGTYKEKLNTHLASIVAGYAGPAAAAEVLKQLGQNVESGAVNKTNVAGSLLEQQIRQKQIAQQNLQMQLMQGGGGHLGAAMKANPFVEKMMNDQGVGITHNVPETEGKVLLKKDADALDSTTQPLRDAMNVVGRIQELRRGGVFPNSPNMGRLETLQKEMANHLSDLKGTKELSTRSIDIWQDFLPGITDHTDVQGRIDASAEELKAQLQGELQSLLARHGRGAGGNTKYPESR